MATKPCPSLEDIKTKHLLPEHLIHLLESDPDALKRLELTWRFAKLPPDNPDKITVKSVIGLIKEDSPEYFIDNLFMIMQFIVYLNLDRRFSFDLVFTDTRIRNFRLLFLDAINVRRDTFTASRILWRYYEACVELQDDPTCFDARHKFLCNYFVFFISDPTWHEFDPIINRKFDNNVKQLFEHYEKEIRGCINDIIKFKEIDLDGLVIFTKGHLNDAHRRLVDLMRIITDTDDVLPQQINGDIHDSEPPRLNNGRVLNALPVLQGVLPIDKKYFDEEVKLLNESSLDEVEGLSTVVEHFEGLGLGEGGRLTSALTLMAALRLTS